MKDKSFPAMKWHPETGESGIFNSASEVPEGWLDHHPNAKEPIKEKEVVKPTGLPMTKAEIQDALKTGGISAPANASAKSLYDLLVTSLRDHLTEANVTFPETATAPELLALVPKSE